MQTLKETAANVAASAMAGMEKTKATAQEKVDRMKARDPVEKQMATEKKEERKKDAELSKQEARENNAAAKQAIAAGRHNPGYTATATYSTTAEQGRPSDVSLARTPDRTTDGAGHRRIGEFSSDWNQHPGRGSGRSDGKWHQWRL